MQKTVTKLSWCTVKPRYTLGSAELKIHQLDTNFYCNGQFPLIITMFIRNKITLREWSSSHISGNYCIFNYFLLFQDSVTSCSKSTKVWIKRTAHIFTRLFHINISFWKVSRPNIQSKIKSNSFNEHIFDTSKNACGNSA